MSTDLEDKFSELWAAAGGPEPVREYRFCPTRRWKADFAFPDAKVLVEIEGGVWLGRKGRHTNPRGFISDCDKYNTATLMGYAVIRLTGEYLNPDYIATLCDFVISRTPSVQGVAGHKFYNKQLQALCDSISNKEMGCSDTAVDSSPAPHQ